MDQLNISASDWSAMLLQVQYCFPEEACGLIAGTCDRVIKIFPITNELHSSEQFRMHGQEQVCAMLEMEERNWDLLAIYHSHPKGPANLSPTDRMSVAYPESISLLWFPGPDQWECKAYKFDGSTFNEIPIRILE